MEGEGERNLRSPSFFFFFSIFILPPFGGLARVGMALRVTITLPRLLFCSLDRFSTTAAVFMERCVWTNSPLFIRLPAGTLVVAAQTQAIKNLEVAEGRAQC